MSNPIPEGRIEKVDLSHIQMNGEGRKIDLDKAQGIASSIQKVGLINPLTLSNDYYLLAGAHRLQAHHILGLAEAICLITDFPYRSLEAELFRIDENLLRNELTILEQGEHLIRRDEILTELGLRAKASPGINQYTETGVVGDIMSPTTFKSTADIASEIGLNERTAQRRKQIIKGLTIEQREAIRDTSLANQMMDLLKIAKIKDPMRKDRVVELMVSDSPPTSIRAAIKQHRIEAGEISDTIDIIKPTNWWGIGKPHYPKVKGFDGSVPGEIYANALYYFAPDSGVAVDSMAGSGMFYRVYKDRHRWQKDRQFSLEIRLFDKYPKEPFASQYQIMMHDALQPLPIMADWLFIDPPYFGQSNHLYQGKLAQTHDYGEYFSLMEQVALSSFKSLNPKGILCLLTNPYITWDGDFIDVPFDTSLIARNIGFIPVFSVVVNRCEQWRPYGGHINNKAKRLRQMYSDTSTLLVFRKGEAT